MVGLVVVNVVVGFDIEIDDDLCEWMFEVY